MNKKKSKMHVILALSIVFLLVFIIILLFINRNNNNRPNEEELILDCSKSAEVNGFFVTLSKKVYIVGNEFKYIDGMYSKIESEYLNGETLTNYYEYQETLVKKNIEDLFGHDYEYVEVKTEIDAKSANFDIVYTINDENKKHMSETLKTNFFDMSIDDMIKQLEGEEFTCESF